MSSNNVPKSDLAGARAPLERGELTRARRALTACLRDSPEAPDLRLQLARLERMSGAFAAARDWLDPLIKAHPKEPTLWLERAILARAMGEGLAEAPAPEFTAIAQGKGPRLPAPSGKWAKTLRLVQAARAKNTLREAWQLVASLPKDAPAAVWNARAELLLARGKPAEALALALNIQRAAPLALEPLLVIARAHIAQGAPLRAVVPAVQASEIAPREAAAVRLAIQCLLQIEAPARARLIWEAPLVPRPKLAMLEARLLLAEAKPASAAACAKIHAKTSADFALLAHAQARSGQSDAALASYARALQLQPDPDIAVARAQLLQSSGQAAEAEVALRDILRAHPTHGLAARALAYGTKLSADDPAVALMEAAPSDRLMQYARAKVAADTGATAQVFPLLAAANASTRALYPFDPDSIRAEEATLTGPVSDTLRQMRASGPETPRPIFVTGMPRSGTTLIERILAAHPEVEAGGELAVTQAAFAPLLDALTAGEIPDSAALAQIAAAYGDGVTERMGHLPARFTDKSIQSYAILGPLARVLPNARIVVVERDPRDVALSIYRNQFSDGSHRYANALPSIAQRYGMFQRMVDHWRAQGVAFYSISYEAILADPEGQSRALLAACDLPWDPACLEFHTSASRVDTLSFAQVRQPLYTSSKGGWQRYAADMQPFLEACTREGVSLDRAND